MNVFNTIRVYPGSWMVTNTRNFSAEEKEEIVSNRIVDSQYGMSVCFVLRSGGQAFIPLSNTCSGTVGKSIDLDTAKVLTLSREGDADITRIEL